MIHQTKYVFLTSATFWVLKEFFSQFHTLTQTGMSRPGPYLLEDVFEQQAGSSHLVLGSGVPWQGGP
jgi:hypothetical protein